MALGFKKPIAADDPRLKGHETTYQASRGGYYPPNQAQQETATQADKPKKRGRRG